MTTTDSITLTLTNRDEVIAFLNRERQQASPVLPEGKFVVVNLPDRSALIYVGDHITRTDSEFLLSNGPGTQAHDRFPRVASTDDNPLSEVNHEFDAAIADAQAKLAEALTDAAAALDSARVQLVRLTESKDAWYVEYAETADGMDADTELAAAERSVRHVQRIAREVAAR